MPQGGIVSPAYSELRNSQQVLSGGLLSTCGLVNIGPPEGRSTHGICTHGVVNWTPAVGVSYDSLWVDDELHMVIRGEVHEVHSSGSHLRLRRSISAVAGATSIKIHDTVTNLGFNRSPHQMLYHISTGFPVVSGSSSLVCGSKHVTPLDTAALDAQELFRFCQGPTPGYGEKVYYHELAADEEGFCRAAVVNPILGNGVGIYVKYDPLNLPHLVETKSMAEGVYAMGIGPANSYGLGLEKMKALDLLRFLEPGEEADYRLEIGVLNGEKAIAAFEEIAMKKAPATPGFATPLV
jgi:hypothetical protein